MSKSFGKSLEWWLKKQSKFINAKIDTRQLEDGTFVLTRWEVDGVPKPSEKELEDILKDYEKEILNEKVVEDQKWLSIKQKLKLDTLTEEEFDLFKRRMR